MLQKRLPFAPDVFGIRDGEFHIFAPDGEFQERFVKGNAADGHGVAGIEGRLGGIQISAETVDKGRFTH